MIDYLRTIVKRLLEKTKGANRASWISLILICTIAGTAVPIFRLNENQILYLFSSASQVIAAIYGLIITGYIFLRNELDRKADKDETLEEIVLLLKTEYFGSIVNISLVTILSISSCFLVIVNEINPYQLILNILINLSVAIIISNLILVVLFVIRILNPNSLEIASNRLRDFTEQDKTAERGSLEDFLKLYNQIEYILDKYGSAFASSENLDYETIKRRRIAKSKLVNILYNEKKISPFLKNNLIELITFRNSLIHGTDLFVTTEDVRLAEQILAELKNVLGIL